MADYITTLQKQLEQLHRQREDAIRSMSEARELREQEQRDLHLQLRDARRIPNNTENADAIEEQKYQNKLFWNEEDKLRKLKKEQIDKEIKETSSDIGYIHDARERQKLEKKKAREKEEEDWNSKKTKIAAGALYGLAEAVQINTRVFRAETAARVSAMNNDYFGMLIGEKEQQIAMTRGIGTLGGGAIGFALGGPVGAFVGSAIGQGLSSILEADSARLERRRQEQDTISNTVKRLGELGPLAGASVEMQVGEFLRNMNEAHSMKDELSKWVKENNEIQAERQNILLDKKKKALKDNIENERAENYFERRKQSIEKSDASDVAKIMSKWALEMQYAVGDIRKQSDRWKKEYDENVERNKKNIEEGRERFKEWQRRMGITPVEQAGLVGQDIFAGLRENIKKMMPREVFKKPNIPEGAIPIGLMPG